MAQLLLEQQFGKVPVTDGGCRNLDPAMKKQEDQALALSVEVLVPKTAAIKAAIANWSDDDVARLCDVGIEVARMRMNPFGARTIAQRFLAKQR
jgi:hypothetical protein